MRLAAHSIVLVLMTLLFSCADKKQQSREHFMKGNEYIFADDFTNAKKEYELAVKIDSNNWKACYSLAGLYELEGDFTNSMHYFSKTIAINPGFSLCYFNRSNLLDLVGEPGTKDLNKTIELKPGFFLALITRGQKLYAEGQYQAALNDFDAAINARSDFYLAYSMRGSCKLKLGDYDGAIKDFDTEITLKPGHVMGYVNRAMAYAANKNYRDAINDINMVISASPGWSQAYVYRGTYEYNLHLNDSACNDFLKASAMQNADADHYLKMYCK